MVIGRVFRFHYGMTKRAAEGIGLGKIVGPIKPDGRKKKKNSQDSPSGVGPTLVDRVIEIDDWKFWNVAAFAPLGSFDPRAQWNKYEAKNEGRGCKHVGNDAKVGIHPCIKKIEEEKTDDDDKGNDRKNGPRNTDPIAEISRLFFVGNHKILSLKTRVILRAGKWSR